jgi:hypothetical protein
MSLTKASRIPATSPETIDKLAVVEERIRERRQVDIVTEHVFHAGMYARTVRIPAGVLFTNVLVKCATLLIIRGEIAISITDDSWMEFKGYNVCPAEAGRKALYLTLSDVEMTMVFPSNAQTVEEAEAEFTDAPETLLSRTNDSDIVLITCQESQQPPRS